MEDEVYRSPRWFRIGCLFFLALSLHFPLYWTGVIHWRLTPLQRETGSRLDQFGMILCALGGVWLTILAMRAKVQIDEFGISIRYFFRCVRVPWTAISMAKTCRRALAAYVYAHDRRYGLITFLTSGAGTLGSNFERIIHRYAPDADIRVVRGLF
jgi:hypothetical protein